ncbi:DUF397 domain-containing protein [Streptomyces sp. NPDC005549]|uniref:DUF397 domain-containing protein n=1 Tax=Streptomyces sp. NPDC005549 TaxID=3154888 RepID=UPI0033A65127
MDREYTGFFKSSYSGDSEQCVEVAPGCGVVPVRDSKNTDAGVITVSREAFKAFTDSVR